MPERCRLFLGCVNILTVAFVVALAMEDVPSSEADGNKQQPQQQQSGRDAAENDQLPVQVAENHADFSQDNEDLIADPAWQLPVEDSLSAIQEEPEGVEPGVEEEGAAGPVLTEAIGAGCDDCRAVCSDCREAAKKTIRLLTECGYCGGEHTTRPADCRVCMRSGGNEATGEGASGDRGENLDPQSSGPNPENQGDGREISREHCDDEECKQEGDMSESPLYSVWRNRVLDILAPSLPPLPNMMDNSEESGANEVLTRTDNSAVSPGVTMQDSSEGYCHGPGDADTSKEPPEHEEEHELRVERAIDSPRARARFGRQDTSSDSDPYPSSSSSSSASSASYQARRPDHGDVEDNVLSTRGRREFNRTGKEESSDDDDDDVVRNDRATEEADIERADARARKGAIDLDAETFPTSTPMTFTVRRNSPSTGHRALSPFLQGYMEQDQEELSGPRLEPLPSSEENSSDYYRCPADGSRRQASPSHRQNRDGSETPSRPAQPSRHPSPRTRQNVIGSSPPHSSRSRPPSPSRHRRNESPPREDRRYAFHDHPECVRLNIASPRAQLNVRIVQQSLQPAPASGPCGNDDDDHDDAGSFRFQPSTSMSYRNFVNAAGSAGFGESSSSSSGRPLEIDPPWLHSSNSAAHRARCRARLSPWLRGRVRDRRRRCGLIMVKALRDDVACTVEEDGKTKRQPGHEDKYFFPRRGDVILRHVVLPGRRVVEIYFPGMEDDLQDGDCLVRLKMDTVTYPTMIILRARAYLFLQAKWMYLGRHQHGVRKPKREKHLR